VSTNRRLRHLGRYAAVVCDVDGVLHVEGSPLPGAATWIDTVQELGVELLLVTNASWDRATTLARLREAHIVVPSRLVVTSGDAVAVELAERGIDRCAVLGAASVPEALVGSGIEVLGVDDVLAEPEKGALVLGVSADPAVSRRWVEIAAARGLPVFATNRDLVYAGGAGRAPGTGTLVARLEAEVAGLRIHACGKPYEPMVRVVERRLGGVAPVLVVGDNPAVDVSFAEQLGADSLLVLTGAAATPGSSRPTMVADDLEEALAVLLEPEVRG